MRILPAILSVLIIGGCAYTPQQQFAVPCFIGERYSAFEMSEADTRHTGPRHRMYEFQAQQKLPRCVP